ncbi:quinol dehydrogenase [Gammaproteobacteria bacterium]|nr:quinol dehydrogenase [Gammaproteobacteria bacterium]
MKFIKKCWNIFWRPSAKWALGTLLILGFIGGVVFVNGFHMGMDSTNTEAFCVGCHEMADNVGVEYTGTVHDSNKTGVRATCSDCHVPKTFVAKMFRKVEASNDLLQSFLGTIDTPEKFEERRGHLAKREWIRFKKSDSQTCRNCHNFDAMDLSAQNNRAKNGHVLAKNTGQTCIDCHKGIAHKLPANAFEIEKEVNAMFENK